MAVKDFVLKHYLIIGLLAVICFGLIFPSVGLAVKGADIFGVLTVAHLAVLLMFFISGLSLDSVTDCLQIKALLLGVGLVLLVTPLLAWPIISIGRNVVDLALLQGMAVFCLVPTTLSSGVTIVAQAQGNVALAILITTCSNLLGVLTMPWSASKIFGASLSVSATDLLGELCWLALAPLAFGILLRKFVAPVNKFIKQHKKKMGMAQNTCILIVVWLMVSGAQHKIVTSKPLDLVACAVLAACVHLIFRAFNGTVSRLFGLKDAEWITVTLMASEKSLPGCVSILSALPRDFHEQVGLMIVPCIMAHAAQLVIDSFLASCWARRMQSKHQAAAASDDGPRQIVFMNIAGAGHINPTLPVVRELTKRGHVVTYFIDDNMRETVEAAGATWKPYRYTDSDFTGLLKFLDEDGIRKYVPEGTPEETYQDFFSTSAYAAEKVLPTLLEDLDSLSPPPAAIVFDAFVTAAKVAAKVRNIPGIGFCPCLGPGIFADFRTREIAQAQESAPWVDGPRQTMKERYGVDILEDGLLNEQFSLECNLVTTIQDLFLPVKSELQKERYGKAPFYCVGPLVDDKLEMRCTGTNGVNTSKAKEIKDTNEGSENNENEGSDDGKVVMSTSTSTAPSTVAPSTVAAAPMPWDMIDSSRAAGKKLVLVSLGTVIPGHFWSNKFGPAARGGGLEDNTGSDLCRKLFSSVVEAVGDDGRFLVLVVLGPNPEARTFFETVPSNFILKETVPQIEVLKRCDAFITHGGANSIHEAFLYSVPVIVVPAFGDQPRNAHAVEDAGVGIGFHYPLKSLETQRLHEALLKLTGYEESQTSYRTSVESLSKMLKSAGGIQKAADIILEEASRPSLKPGLHV